MGFVRFVLWEKKIIMIPKTIHYCWFGRNEKPKLIKKCIDSWKKYCVDYEIIEWNEDNFDIEINAYVKEAYREKKWSFVSDYARLWIVYNYGGVYLDTDVELIREIDDLLVNKAFFGTEDGKYIATGLGFGAEPYNVIVKAMMVDYNSLHFFKADGTCDMLPCPMRNTNSIKKIIEIDKFDKIIYTSYATFYPKEFFCPLDYLTRTMSKTPYTYSIHWYDASWLSKDQYKLRKKRILIYKVDRLKHFPNRILLHLLGEKTYTKLKGIISKLFDF